MPANFDWQTEEEREEVWREAASDAQATPSRRPWLLGLLLLLLIAAGVYAGFSMAQEQVNEAEALTAEEVLASHRLARTAVQNKDRELFVTVLSGRDHQWTQTQYQLFQEKLLFGGAARALDLQPVAQEAEVVDVSFSPDLRQAAVVSEEQVTPPDGNEAITLLQTRVYRRGENRWLLSPPENEFWGEWQLWRGRHLLLHYAERDADIAERLAPDLDALLADICTMLEGLDCPPEMRVRVRLDRDAGSLHVAARSQVSTMVAGEVELPSPTLVGVPVDDTAYATFYRAYARRVMSAVVSDLVGYRCCDHIVFFRALLDWQLAQLGLQAWPLTVDRYLQVAQELDGPGRLARLWSLAELPEGEWPDRWHAYSLVELLLRQGEGAGNAALLQRRLGAADTVLRWVEIVSDYGSVGRLEADWRGYLIERATAWQAAPPPPEQELVLACRHDNRAALFRYSATEERWKRGLPGLQLQAGVVINGIIGLPDGSGVIVSTWEEPASAAAQWLWRPDGVQRLETSRTSFDLYPGDQSGRNMDPLGKYLGVWAMNRDGGDSGHALLDLESCMAGNCAWEAVAGWPIWSPDGEDILYNLHYNTLLQSVIVRQPRERYAPQQVAQGLHPFWLSGEEFGYLSGDDLMLATVSGEEERLLLNVEQLSQQLTGGSHLIFEQALASRGAGGPVLLFLRNTGGGDSFVIRLPSSESASLMGEAPRPVEVKVLLQTGSRVFGPPLATISPSGRWLALHTVGQSEGAFLLYDLESGESVMNSATRAGRQVAAEWAGDGNWLARFSGRYIELISPEHGPYRRPLLPLSESSRATPVCNDLAWVNSVGD